MNSLNQRVSTTAPLDQSVLINNYMTVKNMLSIWRCFRLLSEQTRSTCRIIQLTLFHLNKLNYKITRLIMNKLNYKITRLIIVNKLNYKITQLIVNKLNYKITVKLQGNLFHAVSSDAKQ